MNAQHYSEKTIANISAIMREHNFGALNDSKALSRIRGQLDGLRAISAVLAVEPTVNQPLTRSKAVRPAKAAALGAWEFDALYREAVATANRLEPGWRMARGRYVWLDLPSRLTRFVMPMGNVVRDPRDCKVPVALHWPGGEIPAAAFERKARVVGKGQFEGWYKFEGCNGSGWEAKNYTSKLT